MFTIKYCDNNYEDNRKYVGVVIVHPREKDTKDSPFTIQLIYFSRCGMLAHSFQQPGVYYYCDNNYEDNREYVGVVIVHPREKEHHVEVTEDGFYPGKKHVYMKSSQLYFIHEGNYMQYDMTVTSRYSEGSLFRRFVILNRA